MRKICLFFLIVGMTLQLTACNPETVMLHCDGDNCENTVAVEIENGETPNESWVVFCRKCADTVLRD